jgi:acetylornithine/N-succinyldiaminopimelate aminotransferase
MTTPAGQGTRDIIARYDAYMINNLPRQSVAVVRGQGSKLWDADGREYLDLFSGFGAGVLGHCHPDLVDAVTKQANTLWHVGNLLHTEPQTLLAEAIAKHGFGGKSYFCHSGADANEAAIKLARLRGKRHTGPGGSKKYKVVSAFNSFHGRSFSTMMATAQDKVRVGFEPWLEGFTHVPFNDLIAMRAAVDDQTAAIMVEPIQGEGGCNMPTEEYLRGLRKLADEQNIVLIFDEVWTGCGRTGKYFAHQHWGVVPDVMTLAKGVGGGLAVGVMCAHPRVQEVFDWKDNHNTVAQATTLGGNCLSMAVSARIFQVLERDGLVEKAYKDGKYFKSRIKDIAKRVPGIKEVRGHGLFLGIELDPWAKGATFKNAAEVVNKCMAQGLMLNGTQNVVLRIAPALNITREELDKGLAVVEKVLSER